MLIFNGSNIYPCEDRGGVQDHPAGARRPPPFRGARPVHQDIPVAAVVLKRRRREGADRLLPPEPGNAGTPRIFLSTGCRERPGQSGRRKSWPTQLRRASPARRGAAPE